MNIIKHIKRLFKSLNKRIVQPAYCFLKPLIRWIKNDPYEINLVAHKSFPTSDFALVQKVIDYEHVDFNTWKILALMPRHKLGLDDLTLHASRLEPIYIVLDTKFHNAFGHWFFESAIWVPKIKHILKNYPQAKIYVKEKKGYKQQILFYFGITQDQIVDSFSVNNVCIFVNPITALNDIKHHERFRVMLAEFSNEFYCGLPPKNISYLLLPRQSKENYGSNDRQIGTNDLEDYLSLIPASKVFNTDDSPSFADQIKCLQSSKHILVTDGSPFAVNAFMSKNSVIFVLGDTLLPRQRQIYPKKNHICEFIEHHNAVTYIQSPNDVFLRTCISAWVD